MELFQQKIFLNGTSTVIVVFYHSLLFRNRNSRSLTYDVILQDTGQFSNLLSSGLSRYYYYYGTLLFIYSLSRPKGKVWNHDDSCLTEMNGYWWWIRLITLWRGWVTITWKLVLTINGKTLLNEYLILFLISRYFGKPPVFVYLDHKELRKEVVILSINKEGYRDTLRRGIRNPNVGHNEWLVER